MFLKLDHRYWKGVMISHLILAIATLSQSSQSNLVPTHVHVMDEKGNPLVGWEVEAEVLNTPYPFDDPLDSHGYTTGSIPRNARRVTFHIKDPDYPDRTISHTIEVPAGKNALKKGFVLRLGQYRFLNPVSDDQPSIVRSVPPTESYSMERGLGRWRSVGETEMHYDDRWAPDRCACEGPVVVGCRVIENRRYAIEEENLYRVIRPMEYRVIQEKRPTIIYEEWLPCYYWSP